MSAGIRIIAEVGSNFDGSLKLAQDYIMAVKTAGSSAIKFQTLRKDRLVAPKIWKDGSWEDNPVYVKFSNLEIPEQWHYTLKATADDCRIEFISTPFYLEAVDLLEKIGVRTYKIASGDITFVPLLEAVGHTGKEVILSTGASSLQDVEQALNILFRSGAKNITLLHCVSNYPPLWDEINLLAMITLRNTFVLPVGISDHTPGSLIPIAAAALGATIIEKHVTFDRSRPGPDHHFAMTIDEFADMVEQVKRVEKALGTGRKVPTKSEIIKQHRIRRGRYHPKTLEPTHGPTALWLRPEYKVSSS